jgi:hypothetical protein
MSEAAKKTVHPYVWIWIAVAGIFAGLLGLAEYQRNPLNDPDAARQRTGVVLPPGQEPAPTISSLEIQGRPAVVIFDRSLAGRYLFHDLAHQSDITKNAALIVVTSDGSRPTIETGIDRILSDEDGAIAEAFSLRRPIDGGYPVGYALLDASGFIRFRTLDPGYAGHAWEIRLLLSGLK